MARRVGSKLDGGLGLNRLDRLGSVRASGLYPSKGAGAGQYGSTAYPTILEQYNRASDFKRWAMGQAYYFGASRYWADRRLYTLARFLNSAAGNDELDEAGSKEITTLFPSSTSSERTWYASCRTRGSLILPSPIQAADLSIDTSSANPAEHTLTYNVGGFYSPGQIAVYNSFIGDQFEDTASGPMYPEDLVPEPAGSVALTLIAVNAASGTLVFDLSRPQVRVRRNGRIYWDAPDYDPAAPLTWRANGTRHLCSSFKFFCCCPDHLAGEVANLESPTSGSSVGDLFPRPNTGRAVRAPWESEGVGYYKQWRTLPLRRDERRDCKHIHALRWECGVPWVEPNDYPTGTDRRAMELASSYERDISSGISVLDFFKLQQANWDRFILTLADTVGITVFPAGDVRNEIRPNPAPMLWPDRDEPLASWCRNNDWWMPRGRQVLRIFNSQTRRFQETVIKGGREFPTLQFLNEASPAAPVIVR